MPNETKSMTAMNSRGSLYGAWIVILACIGLHLSLDWILTRIAGEGQETEVQNPSPLSDSMAVGFREELVGKLVVTLASFTPGGPGQAMVRQQIDPLLKADQSAVSNLCGAILLARIGDLEAARGAVDSVTERVRADPKLGGESFLETAGIISRTLQELEGRAADPSDTSSVAVTEARAADPSDTSSVAITAEQSQVLITNLGWYGQLFVSTASPDESFESSLQSGQGILIASLLGFGLIVLIAGGGGLVWLVVIGVRFANQTLADPLKDASVCGGSLPWVFAGWFIVTMLISVGVAVFASRDDRLTGSGALMIQVLAMAVPIGALALARYAGVSWKQVRIDVGLHCGKGFWREFAYGFTTYATAVPMVFVGIVLALILSLFVGEGLGEASHPIQKALAEGSAMDRLMLLFIAAVAAPIVEEIMFRGVLFAHMRDLSRKWGRPLSFVASAVASSFIFAAIHPQGIIFIPILGALATAFCLSRDIRGSLISSMVAHGINNGLIVGLNIALAG